MPADDSEWERLASRFEGLVAMSPDERAIALAGVRDEDVALHDRLAAMLAADGAGSLPFEQGVHVGAVALLDHHEPPRFIGPYRLDRLLGEGGSATVHLATRPDMGHRVAIKFLRDAWLSPVRRERFLSEQRTLAQLNHPAIAKFHDADALPDGTPWLAMEYVDGAPITDHAVRRGLGVRARLQLVREAAVGVRHAHQQAVIHRDLKPSNILVTDGGEVNVVDFGIAKHLGPGDDAEQTRTGLRLMTLAYAAPEQLAGSPIGTFTDVYALGVVLYQLLADRLPFDLAGRTVDEARAIVAQRPVPLPTVVAGATPGRHLRGELEVLVASAMHPDPERRYRDMDAFIRDIDHLLAGEPLDARPDSLGYRAGTFVRRHAGAVASAVAVGATLVALVTFYTVRLREARDAALAETARVEGIQRFTQNLFEGGDESAAPADTLRVLSLLERGVQEVRSLEGDPRTQGELAFTLGSIYHKLGDLPRADSLLRVSLALRQRAGSPPDASIADGMVAIALLRMDQAQYDSAEALVRGAMRRRVASAPARDIASANDRVALGRILEAKGDYPASLEVLGEAVRMHARRDSSSPDYVAAATALANTHFYAGDYDAADSLNTRILALDRARRGPRHPAVAEDLINLGAAQFERGNYKAAEAYYRQALAITRGWYGENHHATAANLTMLGRALVRAERWDEATEILAQALAIRERVFGMDHPNVASTVNELGTIELRRQRWREAERHYQRAARIYRAAYDGKHYLIGIAMSNIGSVRMGEKDWPGAEQAMREALARFTETLPEGNSNIAIARIKLGQALTGGRKYREAMEESRAGFDVLSKEATPSMRFLQIARGSMAAAAAALGDGAAAARYRADSLAAAAPAKP